MQLTLPALRSAVALHLSPSLAERLQPMFDVWAEGVDPENLTLSMASDLIALALTRVEPEEAGPGIDRLILRSVTAVSGEKRQTFAPADIEYHHIADHIEPNFQLAMRVPLRAGVQQAGGVSHEGPEWGQMELWKHEGRVFSATVFLHFSDGDVIAAYGVDGPAHRLCERQCFKGDALFMIGQALQHSAGAIWPDTELAELTAAEPAATGQAPSADPTNTVH